MIEFESLFINKKMGLNIFGFKLKNYNFHGKMFQPTITPGFLFQSTVV